MIVTGQLTQAITDTNGVVLWVTNSVVLAVDYNEDIVTWVPLVSWFVAVGIAAVVFLWMVKRYQNMIGRELRSMRH